jgi:tetratricopeptide (TPR) repeat protein
MNGNVDDAVRMLQAAIAKDGKDGAAYLLLCRAYYSEEQVDDAIRACQNAVKLMPESSEAQDWMGRAYGGRANNAGPLTALKLAHQVHDAFESAVSLDPRSAAAANDLAEYYVGAPGIVGGGLDKAEALAGRVEGTLPQAAHRIRALVAERRKDYASAEREFLTAVAVGHQPEAWVDLGGFYVRRKQNSKAIEALQHAISADKIRDASLVDAASYLMDLKSQPDVALKALQQYLSSGSKSDAAPVIRVHLLISQLLAGSGDRVGAKIELNKALELASNYGAAKRALQGL